MTGTNELAGVIGDKDLVVGGDGGDDGWWDGGWRCRPHDIWMGLRRLVGEMVWVRVPGHNKASPFIALVHEELHHLARRLQVVHHPTNSSFICI